jgi:pimeloyl-ACP methyl ester carboxylesterase
MDSKKTLVFIHGWGVNSKIFEPLFYHLKDDFLVFALDLPGFGKTPIEKPMTLKDYTEIVYEFFKSHNIEKPIIIGHSFGGAVATKLTLLHPESISKLILVCASAIRQPRRKMIFVKKAADILKPLLSEKMRKFILKLLKYDKTDYAQIENLELKETFKNVIKEDLRPYFHLIKIPTLVIWGENDQITPPGEGKIIAENIPGAKLAIIKNAGHFVFLEKPEEFIKLIKEFANHAD